MEEHWAVAISGVEKSIPRACECLLAYHAYHPAKERTGVMSIEKSRSHHEIELKHDEQAAKIAEGTEFKRTWHNG